MTYRWESVGFVACCVCSCIPFIMSKGFANHAFFAIDPLFSREGCVNVLLWGLGYLSVAWEYQEVPFTVCLFALQKVYMAVHWALCRARNMARAEEEGDLPTYIYFSLCYGVGDFACACFFAYVAGSRLAARYDSQLEPAIVGGAAAGAVGLAVPIAILAVRCIARGRTNKARREESSRSLSMSPNASPNHGASYSRGNKRVVLTSSDSKRQKWQRNSASHV
jgi:hypothetical protein